MSSLLAHQLLFKEVKINGQPIEALIDTGAACSVISSRHVKALKIRKLTENHAPALYAANGSEVIVKGSTTVEISVRIGKEEKVADCAVLIVNELATPMIIGSDICALFRIGVFCPDELVFRDSPRVTLNAVIEQQYPAKDNEIESRHKDGNPATKKQGSVRLTETTIVPPHSKMCAPALVEGINGDQEVLVSPFNGGINCFMVARSLCRVRKGLGVVEILNPTNKKIKLETKKRIAKWK